MNDKQSGIILISTLLICSLISMLVLTELELIALHQHATSRLIQQQQNRQLMEQIAHQFIQQTPTQWPPHCQSIGDENPNIIIRELKKNHACQLATYHSGKTDLTLLYWIEDLGIQRCQMITLNKKTYNTHHWRITLTPLDEYSDFLQIRFTTLTTY